MVALKPDVDAQKRYSQSEAARLLGMSACTLRRWEIEGIAKFKRLRANGKKFITGLEILRLWQTVF